MTTLQQSHLSSESEIIPLGTLTLNTITNAKVIAVPFDRAMFVFAGGSVTGNFTVTVTGNTAADGSGTHTVIKTAVFASGQNQGSVEVDSSEVSYAQDQVAASLAFLSVCFRINGTNLDTIKAATQVRTLRQYANQTPKGTSTVGP